MLLLCMSPATSRLGDCSASSSCSVVLGVFVELAERESLVLSTLCQTCNVVSDMLFPPARSHSSRVVAQFRIWAMSASFSSECVPAVSTITNTVHAARNSAALIRVVLLGAGLDHTLIWKFMPGNTDGVHCRLVQLFAAHVLRSADGVLGQVYTNEYD